jgi:hypothetical protein
MTINGWLQIALFGLIVIAITRPFGGYMTRGREDIAEPAAVSGRALRLLVLRRP